MNQRKFVDLPEDFDEGLRESGIADEPKPLDESMASGLAANDSSITRQSTPQSESELSVTDSIDTNEAADAGTLKPEVLDENKASKTDEVRLKPVLLDEKQLYQGLSPIRCFNYHTQLRVAGRLISESMEAEKSSVLILDKNAEQALDILENLGFTLRQALLERKLDIYYYRKGVRNRNFFKNDYQQILEAALAHKTSDVQHVIMIEFNTLFANSVKEAVTNQLEDFCEVARSFDISISGLYSPTNWYQNDFLTEQLPDFIGKNSVREAKAKGGTGIIKYSTRSAHKFVS